MVFEKIEILYNKKVLQLKIKYSEIRKPTFPEFVILATLITHPNKNLSIREILERDLKITNAYIFERALKDLIDFDIVETNKSNDIWSILDMDLKTKDMWVNEIIKENFLKKIYSISQYNKYQDFKLSFDPIKKTYERIREVNWDKRVSGVKYSSLIEVTEKPNFFYNNHFLEDEAIEFMEKNKELFGENSKFIQVELKGKNDTLDPTFVEQNIDNVQKAVEGKLIIENNWFKIETKEKVIDNYLKNNDVAQVEIAKGVLKKYTNKLKEIFIPKTNVGIEGTHYDNFFSLNDISNHYNWSLLLINGEDIYSVDKLLKTKEVTSCSDTIIIYNSKINNKLLEVSNNKNIVYFENMNNEFLNESSLIYVDSENKVKAYTLLDKYLNYLDFKTPVLVESKKLKVLNLDTTFKDSFVKTLENYRWELTQKVFTNSELIYTVSKKLGLELELQKVLIAFLKECLKNNNDINEIRTSYVFENDSEGINFFEKCLCKCIIELTNDDTSFNTLEWIENYSFKKSKNLFRVLQSFYKNTSIENIFLINSILEKNNFDGWLENHNDSLVNLLLYAKDNLKKDLVEENMFDSKTWQQHSLLINKVGELLKDLYNNNLEEVEVNYESILKIIRVVTKENLSMQNYSSYLQALALLLNELYPYYYDVKRKALSVEDHDTINYKVQLLAGSYLSKCEKVLDSNIKENISSFPIELKLAWNKYVENTDTKKEKWINKNETNIFKALCIIFGKQKNFNKKDLDHYQQVFGGN